MKVLVVGSGGREHALAWRLKLSPQVTDLWVAGGNSGTAQIATNVPVSPEDVDGVCTVAKDMAVDLVVVGPEQPLVDGLADRLTAIGIPTFGPSKAAPQLEASKSLHGTSCRMPAYRDPNTGFSTISRLHWTFSIPTKAGLWSRPTVWPLARASHSAATWKKQLLLLRVAPMTGYSVALEIRL